MNSIYPIYSVSVLSKFKKVETRKDGRIRWFSDLIPLTCLPETMKAARAFAATIDPFYVRVFIVAHYANGRTVVREVRK